MHQSKPYTNTTFTRRVDHLAGAHRPGKAASGPRVCKRCGALYMKRRWTTAANYPSSLRAVAASSIVVCPACQMVGARKFAGEVRVSGDFVAAHRAEIERLIRNEAGRAAEDNPMARLVSIRREAPNRLTVRTTTEHLAKRLGQALHKALKGSVHYGFSHENKFAHVTWSRDR